MQPQRGLPFHPSLPVAPHLRQNHNQNTWNSQSPPLSHSAQAPSNLQSQAWQNSYQLAPHYAQAYMQYSNAAPSSWPTTTPEGYTYLSTFVPPRPGILPGYGGATPNFAGPSQTWYQPGSVRCKQPGCIFTGSGNAVETHMMDRHLIYPPGWGNRKRRPDWDADPSLKGKPIPIQGTSIKLDTPEAIDQWIAERKKRFPTADKVTEKQQKLDEAIARGQLPLGDSRFPRKRRKVDHGNDTGAQGGFMGRGRGRGRGRGMDRGSRGRGKGRGGFDGSFAKGSERGIVEPLPRSTIEKNAAKSPDVSSSEENNSDSDGAPEVVSSKAPVIEADAAGAPEEVAIQNAHRITRGQDIQPLKKPAPKQPRKPLHNPFAVRPSLLRNLLLPEIRMTVSNLSQAIRFLVDNDFLDDVELKPGQANEKMIEVINSHDISSNRQGDPPNGDDTQLK